MLASGPVRRLGPVLLVVLAAGLVLRLATLPLWGTFDTEVQKAWAARAVTGGVATIYGPSDAELLARARARGEPLPLALLRTKVPQERFLWGSDSYIVDYPPGSVLVLWGAGTVQRLLTGDLRNRPSFNAAINLAPLLGALAIAALLLGTGSAAEGRLRALLFWLNPAVLLSAPVLGYQDTVFGALALAAVVALQRGSFAVATAAVVVAGLVKPQGALLLPTLLAVVLSEGRPRAWLRAALAGAAAAVLVLLPWLLEGHLLSALDGCLRPLRQTKLAPLGLNVWWVAGWVMDWANGPSRPLARVVPIREFGGWAGWDPRLPARLLVLAGTAANVILLLRGRREERDRIVLSVIVQVHLYALLATSVHENHTLLAVFLSPLLVRREPDPASAPLPGLRLVGATSAFAFASLFLAAGLGRRLTRLRDLEALRLALGLDLTVVVALLHVPLVAWLLLLAWRQGNGTGSGQRAAGARGARLGAPRIE